jgi:hypothetical protein
MGVQMWHPETGGTFEAPDDAVPHYRQSGWLRLDERDEHEARAAERAAAAQAAPAKKTAKDEGK